MSHGDDRKRVFTRASDYDKFMVYVVKAKERYQFYLYAYCLMPNHFHLLLETRLPNISQLMHYIKGSYTTYYNIRHQRHGHLFRGRFKSIVVDKDSYFLELSRYIHLNPVRAGMVKDPYAYCYSSYRGYVGRKNTFIDADQVQRNLGMRRGVYRRFVLEGIKEPTAPLQEVYAGCLLGSTEFIRDKLMDLEVPIASEDVAHRKELHDDAVRVEDIVTAVTAYYRITVDELKVKKARPTKVRQILIYLLRTHTGLTNREIGELVHMRPSAVSKAGLTIERRIETDKSIRRSINTIISTFEG
jgi:REP element-mobilizing transposase RayT